MVSPSCLSAQPTSPPPPPPSQSYSEWSLPAACQLSRQVPPPPCSHTQNGLSWLPAHTDDKSPPAECLPAQPRSPPPAVTLRMVSPSCLPTQTTSPPPPPLQNGLSQLSREVSPLQSHSEWSLPAACPLSRQVPPPPAVTLRVVSPSCLPTQTTSPPSCSHTQNGHSQLPAHTNDKSPPPPPICMQSYCSAGVHIESVFYWLLRP